MSFGFTHRGGWLSLLDVVNECTVQEQGRTGRRIIAAQAKQKLSGLRYHMRCGEAFTGARSMAERYSDRVSALQGRPGLLQLGDGDYCTLAPGGCGRWHNSKAEPDTCRGGQVCGMVLA